MLHTLNVAQTGLRTSQTQVENVMNNIANENVAGYKKRVVNVSELGHADARITGRGLFIDGVSRTTQVYMYQNLIEENSRLYDLKELNTTLAEIESIFKETDDAGLSVNINNYFKSIENLRTTPHSEIYKKDIINNANSIILELQNTYSSIERKEATLLNNAEDVVNKVNTILTEIGEISEKILKDTYGSPNDLLDKRDALEKELSQYVDIEISRDEHYQLKIGGATAVRFSTNVHEIDLVKDYSPQQDAYVTLQSNGAPNINSDTNDMISSLPTFTGSSNVAEVQTLNITGNVSSKGIVNFLGTDITIASGTNANDTATALAAAFTADTNNIASTWNNNNPNREINTITATGNQLTITYKSTEGDVEALNNSESNGINFTGSIEDITAANAGKGINESLTYTINGKESITVTIGETIRDITGATVDFDSSGVNGGGVGVINENNILQALVYQINNHSDYKDVVSAYNGKYETNSSGNIITTDNSDHSKFLHPSTTNPPNPNTPGHIDRYLFVEARHGGTSGKFSSQLLVNKEISNPNYNVVTNPDVPQNLNEGTYISRTDNISEDAKDDIHLEIYEKEISINGGSLKPMLNNLDSTSSNNLFNTYKEKLDQFAQKLVDLTESYIENSDYSYIYGNTAVNESYDADKAVNINLFNGSSVKTLEFNEVALNDMTQEKLDYLADLQWKEDIDFDGTGEYNQSFSEFYQTLRVSVADDREGIIFQEEAQQAITESLQSNYDNIVKVDKDEELVELIKFQKAYEANAKIITVIDELLSTLLNIKR